MSKPSQRIRLGDRFERPLDGSLQCSPRPCPSRPQRLLALRTARLNRRKIRRVRRQIDQPRAAPFYRLADAAHLMCPQVIHHHYVTGLQCRAEDAFGVGTEYFTIRRPLDHQQRLESLAAQGADQREMLSIVDRRTANRPRTPRGTAIKRCQGQINPRFINELAAPQIEPLERFRVLGAGLLDARGVALNGVERLFLRGRSRACSKRHSVGRETASLCLACRRRRSSSSVRSLSCSSAARMNSRAFSLSAGCLPPPCGKASGG